MNSQNLIPVFNGKISHSEALLCDARKLHEFLQVNTKFTMWIQRRIEEYGFVENQDFLVTQNWETKNSGRGGNRKAVLEYHITLDMAKELAMVERNEQGRAARRYFIECEKKLNEQTKTPTKKLPSKINRRIRSREDLSFTRRDNMGRLINWFPPTNEQGGYDWYEAYAIGQAWFAEVVALANNNPEEAYYSLAYATKLMAGYARDVDSQGLGFVEGFFSTMARYTLAGIVQYPKGVAFPFAKPLNRNVDLTEYLKQATPLPDDELHWQAWQMSQPCRDACFKEALSQLMR